jgi:hypothetical protein
VFHIFLYGDIVINIPRIVKRDYTRNPALRTGGLLLLPSERNYGAAEITEFTECSENPKRIKNPFLPPDCFPIASES